MVNDEELRRFLMVIALHDYDAPVRSCGLLLRQALDRGLLDRRVGGRKFLLVVTAAGMRFMHRRRT